MTQLRLFNTATQEVRPFTRGRVGPIRMYVCGPTPYSKAHIGHAKSYLTYDVLRRFLEFLGEEVEHITCVTDVADEIVKKAAKKGIPEEEVSREFEEEFFKDLDRLGNLHAYKSPRVSDNMEYIIETIQRLSDKGLTEERGGKIYLKLNMEDYGTLSHVSLKQSIVEGEENMGTLDILVWDTTSQGRKWHSPWGEGRPGWHVQCYVFIKIYLGYPVDIHGGGLDLVFPHHESEDIIAKILDEGETCRWWVHNGLILVGQNKMSKSKGNIVELHQLINHYGPDTVRLYILSQHYRETSIFSPKDVIMWEKICDKILASVEKANIIWKTNGMPKPIGWTVDARKNLVEALADDLRTDRAIEILVNAADQIEEKCRPGDAAGYLLLVEDAAKLLGIFNCAQDRFTHS